MFDETRPYITRSIGRQVEELSVVSRAARSLAGVSRRMRNRNQDSYILSTSAKLDALSSAVVANIFRDADIPYAIAGALACGLWSVPCGTIDVDMNVFVLRNSASGIRDVLNLLENKGVLFCDDNEEPISKEMCSISIRNGSDLIGTLGLMRLTIFFSNGSPADLTLLAKERCELVEIDSEQISFLSAESIAIFKLICKRSKDVADLEKLFCTQRGTLDTSNVCYFNNYMKKTSH